MMKRVYEFVAITFWVVGTPWYGLLVFDDLMHPDRWDDGPLHDPRIYLPLMLCVGLFVAWSVWSQHRRQIEIDRMIVRTAKLKEFVETVDRQRAEGKWDEDRETQRLCTEWKKQQEP